jgi:transcriptional regulator with XRE-family HTH domain
MPIYIDTIVDKPLTGKEICAIRQGLRLTQAQLASLLNVHPITVSNWERTRVTPSPYHSDMLRSFGRAAHSNPKIGETIRNVLVGAGIGVALYLLLDAAFGKKK